MAAKRSKVYRLCSSGKLILARPHNKSNHLYESTAQSINQIFYYWGNTRKPIFSSTLFLEWNLFRGFNGQTITRFSVCMCAWTLIKCSTADILTTFCSFSVIWVAYFKHFPYQFQYSSVDLHISTRALLSQKRFLSNKLLVLTNNQIV